MYKNKNPLRAQNNVWHFYEKSWKSCLVSSGCNVNQQFPTCVAPGTGFVEDSFSTDWGGGDGFGIIQTHYIQAHLLLCGPVPNRPGPVPIHGPEVADP